MRLLKQLFIAALFLLLSACGQQATTPTFQQLKLSVFPNHYLVCPQNYCNVKPDAYSIVYPVSAEDLFYAWNAVIARQHFVNFVSSVPDIGQYQLEQRSIFFGMPDDIAVQFIALSNTTSTLAVYSYSRYGVYDFGTNKKRVQQWLMQLNQMLGIVQK